MSIDRKRQAKAADDLEEITIAAKEIIKQLRAGQDDQLAYAMLYHLRWKMGQIVSRMGIGQPVHARMTQADEIYESQVWIEMPTGVGTES